MSKTTETRQSSFSTGELSPSLYGADHLPAYGSAARILRNLLVTQQGTLVNRAGTVFCGEVKTSADLTRLLRMDFSDDQSYAIEAGEKYFRPWNSDGTRLVAEALLAITATPIHSTDKGATWSDLPALPHSTYLCECQVADGRILAFPGSPNNVVDYSDDGGLTWSTVSIPAPGADYYRAAAFNGHTIVAVALNFISYSTDNGLTWTAVATPPTMIVYSVAWGNGRWLAVGISAAGGKARYSHSYDGVTWSTATALASLDPAYTISALNSACFLAGEFVAVGNAWTPGNSEALWARIGLPEFNWSWGVLGSNLGDLSGIASDGKTLAVAVGGTVSTAIAWKYDAVTTAWTNLSPSGTSNYRSVAYSRGYWVATANNRISRYNGTAWESDPSVPARSYNPIAACKGTEIMELATPYGSPDLAGLSTVQTGDIVTMCQPTGGNVAPQSSAVDTDPLVAEIEIRRVLLGMWPIEIPMGVDTPYKETLLLADVLRQIDEARERGAKVLFLVVDSIGGHSRAGFALYHELRAFAEAGGLIVAYVDAAVMSNAAFYVLGADYVVAHPGAMFGVHGLVPVGRDRNGVKVDDAAALEKVRALEESFAAAVLLTRTLAPGHLIRRWLSAKSAVVPSSDELLANADEAQGLGFVDHIGGRERARAFAGWLAHVPGAEARSPRRDALAGRGGGPACAETMRLLREYGAAVTKRERERLLAVHSEQAARGRD